MRRITLYTAVGAAVALGIAAAALASPTRPLKVTSSLDRKTVLPLRSHWLAYPKPAANISRVDFLIDGKVRWVEHKAPYNYGSDDGRNFAFLITTFLRPGMHRFTVRAVDYSGHKATDTVTARVLPAPDPPASLAGTWTRTLTDADIKKATSGQPPPTGVWKLVFDNVGSWELDPLGSGVVNEYDTTPTEIHVYAPITIAPRGVSKYGGTDIGCCDCNEAGPFGTYTWSVNGNDLTLKAENELCGDRRAIWEGTWTRAD